jgi:hypothetical protein
VGKSVGELLAEVELFCFGGDWGSYGGVTVWEEGCG